MTPEEFRKSGNHAQQHEWAYYPDKFAEAYAKHENEAKNNQIAELNSSLGYAENENNKLIDKIAELEELLLIIDNDTDASMQLSDKDVERIKQALK